MDDDSVPERYVKGNSLSVFYPLCYTPVIRHSPFTLHPSFMAYTFTDHYRAVRTVLRMDGLLVGVGLGTLLLIYPTQWFAALGFAVDGATWAIRMGGGGLVGLGVGLIMASSERELRIGSLMAAIVGNGAMAGAILVSYLRSDLADLTAWGQALLLIFFVICLLSTVLPIPYVRGIQRLE